MKHLKKTMALLLVAVLLLAGCGSTPAQPSEQETGGAAAAEPEKTYLIRAGIGLNDQHPQYLGLEIMKEYIERESNGRIEMQLFHSSQLGDDIQMMEALQMGSQEITCPSSAPISSIDKRNMVFDLPFLFPSEEVASAFLDGAFGQELLDGLEDHGLVGLAYWENGYRHLTNSVREVRTPEDLRGLKIRTMENQIHLDFFRELGANPTPMPFGELFTAMQQGVVDGQENPVSTIYLQSFSEVQDYTTLTGHVYSPFVLLMSKVFWDELPEDLKEIVQEAAYVAQEEQRRISREYADEMVEGLREQGMTVTELTLEELQAFQQVTSSTIDKFKGDIGADYVDQVLEEIQRLTNEMM
ncbi:TRAP transporter substrate-binding protein [Anoxynatronum sibiricum]|uniref:TRAP transporter substrate-binding protein n=1 Tax=Anoxynatronum sibiricum TaxID=210623 RepID=A0ABU9VWI7_9CLOT